MAAGAVDHYLESGVCEELRREISIHGGNEIFFRGTCRTTGTVGEAEALAWGNETATPALLRHLVPGDVVIHNHPSGDLTPSDADIQTASLVGNQGIGFYIVDNAVENIAVVVNPYVPPETVPLDPGEVRCLLDEGSAVADRLPGYEPRPGQVDMAAAVADGFNSGSILLVEAGTGTGKTLAYLIPAILWARRNGERVVVSTNTINLQEQLVFKDIPFLEKTLEEPFVSVLVKGRGNYCCLRKTDAEEHELGLFKDDEDRDEIRTLIQWSHSTRDGSLSDLNFIPKGEVWDRLKCDSDTCTGVRCAFYEECFLVNARRRAAQADILIVNHHLLFADLALRGSLGSLADIAVLPPYTRIIIDEAHHIEAASTDYFGRQVSQAGIRRVLGRLLSLSKRGDRKGLLPTVLAVVRQAKSTSGRGEHVGTVLTTVEENLMTDILDIGSYSEDVFSDIADFLARKEQNTTDEWQFMLDERFLEDRDWTDLILVKAKGLASRMREFSARLHDLADSLDTLAELIAVRVENLLIELRAQVRRIADTADCLAYLLFDEDLSVVKWVELTEKRKNVKLCGAPIEVGDSLREALFNPYKTVVMTSATLTVGGSFDFIRSRLGIDSDETPRVSVRSLTSPFDFKNQVLIGIPTNNHPPDHPGFAAASHALIAESLKISRGRAFVLFTSYRAMGDAYAYCSAALAGSALKFFRQGSDTRHTILNRFRQESAAALFATDSFWEGVDITGRALESIIIARLPFRVPTIPVEIARRDAIDRAGGNSFLDYTIPTAVIKFTQGFGRLIRHKSDRGTILILDNRIIKKAYGRIFLSSLPECRTVIGRDDEVFGEFRDFYAEQTAP